MAVNKVVINTHEGSKTLIDLTESTVTPETLSLGVVAYNAKGERIVGTNVDAYYMRTNTMNFYVGCKTVIMDEITFQTV